MVKLLFYKMLRDLKKSAGTYLVCVLIIAVGMTGYSVLSILGEQMNEARESFYRETDFSDLFAEVQEAPENVVRSLEKISGIARAEGRIIKTVPVAGFSGNVPELKLMSYTPEGMNRPFLSLGNLPAGGGREIIIGQGYYQARALAPGGQISLKIEGREMPFTVTGSGMTPESIYMIKSMVDMLPNPAQYDAAFMLRDDMARLFSMEGRVNNLILRLSPGVLLSDVEDEVRRVLSPYGCYRVYGREDELSCSVLDMEIDQINRMAKAIPFLFLGISAVVLYIALGRMVEKQRTQIGTLMAVGIPGSIIAAHYTFYGAVTGCVGGFLGGVLGNLSAIPMAEYYRTYFTLPETPIRLSGGYVAASVLMAACFCAAVGFLSARGCLGLDPAEAMHPAPPKTAKVTPMEKLPFFTALFTVPGIMAIRSVFRNRRRSLLSLFGIACAYMITTALVSMGTLFDVYLFDDLEKNQGQDLTVAFTSPVMGKDALRAVRHPAVSRAEGILEIPVVFRGTTGTMDGIVRGMDVDSTLCRIYDERGNAFSVAEEGVVLSRHMANLLGASVGSRIELEVIYPRSRISSVPVTGITEQYLGTTAYVSHRTVGRISDYRGAYTSVLLKAPLDLQDELSGRLSDAAQLAGVKNRQDVIDAYRGMMGSVSGIMGGMALIGILVGVAVIYVSSIISYEELKREISILMMLGMHSRECLDVISVGQWMLTLVSFALGIPLTYGASFLMMRVVAGELFSIPPFISAGSLLFGAALTLVSVFFSSVAMHRKLKKLVPIDLTRERE